MFEENNKRISQKNYKNLLKKHFYKNIRWSCQSNREKQRENRNFMLIYEFI